jgi:hypothetical protein
MDEMTELRRMRVEVPLLEPEQLVRAMVLPWEGAHRNEARGSHPRLKRGRELPRRWPARVALTLVAVGVATAVAIPELRTGLELHKRGGGAVSLSARGVLLVSARQSEHQLVGPSGKYWWTRTVDGAAWQVGPSGDPYVVVERVEHQVWQRRTRHGGLEEILSVRSLGTHPETEADVAAWRRDGSPSQWVVSYPGSGSNGSTVPMTRELRARPVVAEVTRTSVPCLVTEGEPVPDQGTCMGIEPAYELPTDPADLAEALVSGELTQDPEGATGALFLLAGGQILSDGGLLVGEPVTPEVRAEVFRALADLPGVRSLGTVRDPLGRQGVAIATATRPESGPEELERWLIIDPIAGRMLAVVDVAQSASANSQWARPGDAVRWAAIAGSGWTDQAPTQPPKY